MAIKISGSTIIDDSRNIVNAGVITATSFVGDGSGLTGVVGGAVVGSAGTWAVNAAGIHTSKNVGIGTELSTDALTVVGDGNFSGVVTATRFESSSAGTPTIDSPGNLNINAINVAISTDATIGGDLVVSGINTLNSGGIDVAGVVTAYSYYGDGSNLTGIAASFAGAASTITNTQIQNWDTSYSWGDHGVVGYTTTGYVDTAIAGVATFSGNYNDLTNKPTIPSVINDLSDVNAGAPSTGQVLKWSGSEWQAAADLTAAGAGIGLSDLSVTINPAGINSLTYSSATGVFVFTPTNLSGYLTTETSHADVVVDGDFASQGLMRRGAAEGTYSIVTDNSADWNTAYGWGDHSVVGYATETYVGLQTFVGAATTITTTQIQNWDTSYSWGDHGVVGYLTSYTETQTLDDVLTQGSSTTQDIITTGKIYFSNVFTDLTALNAVSASTYHGMFAHVHSEGHGYFAHSGSWTQLLDTGSNLSELADVVATSPSANDVLTWNGSSWAPASSVVYADTAGIATYSESAGVSTDVVGGQASVIQLNVSGITTLGVTTTTHLTAQQVNVSGIVTATRFESTSAGTPTIDSPNNLNINAVTVAISTDVTIGGDIESVRNIVSGGIVTAHQFTTGSSGIAITANSITGPSTIFLDPAGDGGSIGTVFIRGNLQVTGEQTIINSTTLEVGDKTIVIAKDAPDPVTADGAGIFVNGGNASITYTAAGDKWVLDRPPYFNLARILTVDDEGSGNGLDADTLDTIQASQFARLDIPNSGIITATTFSGNISGVAATFTGSSTLGVTTSTSLFANDLGVSGVTTFGPGLTGDDGDIDFQHNGATRAYWDGSAGTLNFKDGSGITLGNDDDFSISFDGSNTYLTTKSTDAGSDLYIQADEILLRRFDGGETMAQFTERGAVKLNYSGVTKIQTTSSGVLIGGFIDAGSIGVTSTLNVSGVSTFNDNVRVAGIVTANSVLVSNDGSNNGSVLIQDLGSYSNIAFRASNGTTQTQIQGVEANLYVTPGSGGFIGLSGPLNNLFYDTGDVILNNGLNGTTHAANGLRVTGLTSTTSLNVSGNVSVGGTISIDGGVTLATNNATIVGTLGTAGEIKQIGGAPFYYDGSAWREFVLSSGTPVSVPADTEWDSVVFRATFDSDFSDAKFGATPVFVSAGSSIVGAAVTIGTGAYRNIGGAVSGVGVSYAYRSDYDFTGSWTIEFWIYHDSTPSTFESLVSQVSTIDDSGDWTLGMYNNGSNIYVYWANENNAAGNRLLDVNGIATWTSKYLDKWAHYALVRESDSGALHFYINGTESLFTINDAVIDNDILHINGAGLGFGAAFGDSIPNINGTTWNSTYSIDAIFDDVRISCGVGTAGQRYDSIGISTYATFTPPTTALPTTGTLSSYVQPPGDKYGEITLGGSPTWRGTSGVTVSQQSSGNYRVSFASTYTNANDYYVLSQGMDQGFASYVGIARSTTHVDLAVNKQSDDSAVDTGALAVQIKNHI